MKKIQTAKSLLSTAGIAGAAAYCCLRSAEVSVEVSCALERCLKTLIPSLYAMMIAAVLLVRSGAAGAFGMIADKLSRLIFGMSGEEFSALTAGIFTGYLSGAKMLCAMYDEGRLSARRGGLLCGVCYGAGPAFISGCIASRLYGSPSAGRIILISTAVADIIIAFAVSPLLRRSKPSAPHKPKISINSAMLMDCTLSAGSSMADVCFITAAFAAAVSMLKGTGIIRLTGSCLKVLAPMSSSAEEALSMPLFDVTAVSELPVQDYTLLPVICGFTAFGGVCVLLQLSAVCRGKFSILPAVLMRIAAGVISYFICRALMPHMLDGEAVPAAVVKVSAHSEPSPVPSIMLLIMTLMLMNSVKQKKQP